jgi:hypothetical protein
MFKKNNLFFVGILKVTDGKNGSRSVSKCHEYRTLLVGFALVSL